MSKTIARKHNKRTTNVLVGIIKTAKTHDLIMVHSRQDTGVADTRQHACRCPRVTDFGCMVDEY